MSDVNDDMRSVRTNVAGTRDDLSQIDRSLREIDRLLDGMPSKTEWIVGAIIFTSAFVAFDLVLLFLVSR